LAVEVILSVRRILLGASLATAGALGLAVSAASAADANPQHCFAAQNWTGWKSPSPKVIYLNINFHQVYRLDLSAGSSELQDPEVHLVNRVRGSDWICSPLDLQLEVSDVSGFREPLIVKSITHLTPDEVMAIPPKFRP
jgi:hypothetical protein